MGLQETASRILVIGTTGSGKSTFINLVSGSTLSVSDGLKSCTSEVLESRPFSLDDQSIALIDTPGFDDTTRVDTDIITTMSTYLANMYKEGVKLSGVIYMHRISDVRMGGTSLLSFRIFRELCGNESLCNALIVTTMWSLVDPKLGESREQELATTDDLFKPALDHGAQLVRHDGTLESAQNILRHLITNKSTTLRIQRELVDEGRVLSDTSAGAELVCHFAEQAGRLEARSRKLHKQMNDPFLAQDEEGRAMLQIELEEMQRGERRIEDEIERLRKMTSSAIDTHSDWVTIESVEHPLGNLQVELPTKEQVRTALQEQFSRLQERLQNEAYLQSRSRELEDEQKRVEYARRIAEETQEMQRRNDVMLQEEERHQEHSEIPYLILCGAVILKVFEFIAYTVF